MNENDKLLKEAIDEVRSNLERMSLLYNERTNYSNQYGQPFPSLVANEFETNNATDTSNRHPDSRVSSWMHYWQIVTNNFGNETYCRACGKPIFADINSTQCKILASELGVKKEELQACGGHIRVPGYREYYITPLCPSCNAKNISLHLKIGDVLAREDHAQISD